MNRVTPQRDPAEDVLSRIINEMPSGEGLSQEQIIARILALTPNVPPIVERPTFVDDIGDVIGDAANTLGDFMQTDLMKGIIVAGSAALAVLTAGALSPVLAAAVMYAWGVFITSLPQILQGKPVFRVIGAALIGQTIKTGDALAARAGVNAEDRKKLADATGVNIPENAPPAEKERLTREAADKYTASRYVGYALNLTRDLGLKAAVAEAMDIARQSRSDLDTALVSVGLTPQRVAAEYGLTEVAPNTFTPGGRVDAAAFALNAHLGEYVYDVDWFDPITGDPITNVGGLYGLLAAARQRFAPPAQIAALNRMIKDAEALCFRFPWSVERGGLNACLARREGETTEGELWAALQNAISRGASPEVIAELRRQHQAKLDEIFKKSEEEAAARTEYEHFVDPVSFPFGSGYFIQPKPTIEEFAGFKAWYDTVPPFDSGVDHARFQKMSDDAFAARRKAIEEAGVFDTPDAPAPPAYRADYYAFNEYRALVQRCKQNPSGEGCAPLTAIGALGDVRTPITSSGRGDVVDFVLNPGGTGATGNAISLISAAVAGYHGYARNKGGSPTKRRGAGEYDGILWGLAWAAFGAAVPIAAIPLALYQGYGRRASRTTRIRRGRSR